MTASADPYERLLVEAFPFHLQVDGDGRVSRVGASLQRVCPQLVPGAHVGEVLRISSPREAAWQRGPGDDVPAGLVIVHATAGELVLRGQLLPAGDGVLFLGSPWVTSLPSLTSLGLRLDDFAAADPVTDFVMLLGAQASALADAERLAAQLEGTVAALAHRDAHDALTGLANRARFTTVLTDAMPTARDAGGSVCVVLIDLDRFQEINDSLGQEVGDRLLQQVGPRIVSALDGGSQLVARFGGDEFALLLSSPQQGEAALLLYRTTARRVLDAIEEPFVVDGVSLVMEASAGVAMAPEDGSSVAALLRHADAAMHRAKSDQEDIAVYRPGLDGHDPRRLRLLAELRA
ncbi:MAG TPA: diguanylate cyclase, partial [Actinomycetales bacterium]